MSANPGRRNGRYAVTVAGKHIAPSVTTVLGVINKPGLPWGAAKESALYAVDQAAALARLPHAAAVDAIRKAHKVVWDAKRDRGSAVHDMAADWAAGRDVDCPADCSGYLDALERFYAECAPTMLHVERCVVSSTHGYGGAFDFVARIGGRNLLVDIKTGSRYPIEATMQLAAYRHADGMGVYDATGELVAIEAMPQIDAAALLYLHDDGTYELLEVPADAEAFADFLSALALHSALARLGRWERAHPAPVAAPVPTLVAARPAMAANVEALVA